MAKTSSRNYMCTLCNGKFQFDDIRYSRDGKRLICINCYNKVTNEDAEKKKRIEVAPASNQLSENIKLICIDCRYKFSLKKTASNIRCPYCGKNRLMKDDITADKLIEEVSRNINEGRNNYGLGIY